MKRGLLSFVSFLTALMALCVGPAHAQTPGRVPVFDQPGTGGCNAAGGNDCLDSVMFQDGSGNIGIGTGTPLARLHIAAGNLYLEDSTATSGNILKQGFPFLHNFGPANLFLGTGAGNFGAITGDTNTGIGYAALAAITGGFSNTAVGGGALNLNTTGHTNTAVGRGAMQSNTEGYENSALGRSALISNTTGFGNTAVGVNALQSNRSGFYNTALGHGALSLNDAGTDNVAIGYGALGAFPNGNNNIAIGSRAAIYSQGGSNNIYIGYPGSAPFTESNTIRIGACSGLSGCGVLGPTYIGGIVTTILTGSQVLIDSNGQLGVAPSSRRFKEEIRDMGEATAGLRRLRPVTFYYKDGVQHGGRQLQYGLIAEEVAAVYPELVEYSDTGEPFAVRYQELGAMLLNELHRQDRRLEEQQQQIQAQEARIAQLEAQISGLALRIEKAGARRP